MVWTAAVTEGGAWAQITSGASGNNGGTIHVGYLANPVGGSARKATIVVTADGASGSPVTLTVNQAPTSPSQRYMV